MSILTDSINNVKSVFTGQSIIADYKLTSLTSTITVNDYGLQDSTELFYEFFVTLDNGTWTGKSVHGSGSIFVGQTQGFTDYKITYSKKSVYPPYAQTLKLKIYGDLPLKNNGTIYFSNTSNVYQTKEVLFAEGEWASFNYDKSGDGIEPYSYIIPVINDATANTAGHLKSPYWLPLQITIRIEASGFTQRTFWDFATGCYKIQGSNNVAFNLYWPATTFDNVNYPTMTLKPTRSGWPGGGGTYYSIKLYGTHWIAVSPYIGIAPPRLLVYNNKLLSYSGNILGRKRSYDIIQQTSGYLHTDLYSNSDTRFINNYSSSTYTIGWNLSRDNCSAIGLTSSDWRTSTITGSVASSNLNNGFAAPSPYWITPQPTDSVLTNTDFDVLKSNNQVVAKSSGTAFSQYSNLIPMFIHASPASNNDVYWDINSSVNPSIVGDFDNDIYISHGEVIGADNTTQTCLLYAYNSDNNILSFASGSAARQKQLENAICGAQRLSVEFYLNNVRYCVRYARYPTWELQAASGAENTLFYLKHYGVNVSIEEDEGGRYVAIYNGTLYAELKDSSGNRISPYATIISGEHYTY